MDSEQRLNTDSRRLIISNFSIHNNISDFASATGVKSSGNQSNLRHQNRLYKRNCGSRVTTDYFVILMAMYPVNGPSVKKIQIYAPSFGWRSSPQFRHTA